MNSSKSDCIGIDLTQSTPHLAVASRAVNAECSVPANSPPAALLPVLQGESPIVGKAAHTHRRGMGDRWPPECQVPVNGENENGSGRVPLVCAWTRLSNLSTNAFSGFLGDTAISWQPQGQKRLYSSAEKIIAASVQAWEKKYQNPRTVVVVPDSLGEAAQQALVDNCGSFLIPRPIAVAMSWCRQNAHKFSTPDNISIRGVTLGHLLVVTLPFDRWEVVPIEIRAMVYNEKLWLVPIRNRVGGGGDFPRIGVNLFMAMAGAGGASLHEIWRGVFGSQKNLPEGVNGQVSKDVVEAVRACMKDGISLSAEKYLYNIKPFSELFLQRAELRPEVFKERLVSEYTRQCKYLPADAKRKCLGIVVDGACTSVPIAEKKFTLGSFVASAFGESNVQISNNGMAAYGAAVTAYALEHNLPSYRETIIPVDIHYHGKNEKGDNVNAYKLLVEGKTVEAGEEYKSKEPVQGLYIKHGETKLALTLRRSEEQNSYLFRRVTAEIPKPTTRDEEVKIVAHLRPGQGFAKVFIDSVHQGVFNTRLDWRTMEDCEEPTPPALAYLPEVSRVVHDKYMWADAKYLVEEAIDELKYGGRRLAVLMKELREDGAFNKWPMADSYDENRGYAPKGDIFRHYGICPSDGNLDSVSSPSLMKKFASACGERFVTNTITSAQKQQIQRTASWMYLACPEVVINQVRKNLKRELARIKMVDLHHIGLCWCDPQDLELFYFAFEQRLLQGSTGVNEWLRACRNIVRFRDAALHPDIIPERRLNIIVTRIIRILERQEQERNFSTIFNNCILTSLYLLKRRRYNKEFLNSENHEASTLDSVLDRLLKEKSNDLKDRQRTIIKVTLKFLRKEASLKDLDDSVLKG